MTSTFPSLTKSQTPHHYRSIKNDILRRRKLIFVENDSAKNVWRLLLFSFAKITLKIVNIYIISYISRENVHIWHVDLLLAISFNDLYLSKIHIIHVGVFFLSLAKFQNWWYLVPGIYSITFHSWLSSTLQHDLFLKVWLPIFLQYLQMFMIKCISYVIWKKLLKSSIFSGAFFLLQGMSRSALQKKTYCFGYLPNLSFLRLENFL